MGYKTITIMTLFDEERGAEFSPCSKYRYKLWRIWDSSKPIVMCIGLNPSNANHTDDDPTIRNLIRMLTQLGYGGFYMTNLFAIISPKPEVLITCDDPLGANEVKLKEVSEICKEVIFCWGTFKQARERAKHIIPRFPDAKCFGFNSDGSPFHPMGMTYMKGAISNPVLQIFNNKG